MLDSYDNVETCVNNSQQILDTFNDAFFAEKESYSEEKTLMKKQQMEIINLLTSNPDSGSSSADISKGKKADLTDTQWQQKCQAVENMIKNPQEFIKQNLNKLVDEKNQIGDFFEIFINLKLSIKMQPIVSRYMKTLQKLKEEFFKNSQSRINSMHFNNFDPNNFCVLNDGKYFCIKDYEEIRIKFFKETTAYCDLNYIPGMKFDQFFNLFLCEEYDFINREWKIESLKTMYQFHGYVSQYHDIKLLPKITFNRKNYFRIIKPKYNLGSYISQAISNLFELEKSVKEPTRKELEKFLVTKLDQFKDGLDCSIFKTQSWLDSVFKMFGLLRKAIKSVSNVVRVFKDCVQPSYNLLKDKSMQIKAKIANKSILKFDQYSLENEKNTLIEAAKADSEEKLKSTIKENIFKELDLELQVAFEVKNEEAANISELESKKPEAERESNLLPLSLQLRKVNKKLEKSKVEQAINNAEKIKVLEESDKSKIADSFASLDKEVNDIFYDPFSDSDPDVGIFSKSALEALREAQVADKIIQKVNKKSDKFLQEQKKEFKKNPFGYSMKIAANGVMCAAEPWLCAARGAAYLTKFAIVDEVDLQADKLIKKAMNSNIIKDVPEIVQDLVEFSAKNAKKKLTKALDKKIEGQIRGIVSEFDKKEITNQAFKDVKFVGDAIDFLKMEGKKFVIEEIQLKFPNVNVSAIETVGKTGYEFYKFRKDKKAKRQAAKASTSISKYKKRKILGEIQTKLKEDQLKYLKLKIIILFQKQIFLQKIIKCI